MNCFQEFCGGTFCDLGIVIIVYQDITTGKIIAYVYSPSLHAIYPDKNFAPKLNAFLSQLGSIQGSIETATLAGYIKEAILEVIFNPIDE
jgi:hypothetical protein